MVNHLPSAYYNAYSEITNEKSKQFIIYTVNRMESLININFQDWNLKTFLNTDDIEDKIKDEIPSAQIHLLGTIKRFLSYKGKTNIMIYKTYNKKINAKYKLLNKNRSIEKINKNKEINTITYNQMKSIFISKISEIKQYGYIKFRNYLILGFYLLQTPSRLCNLVHMKYIKEPKTLLKNIENKEFNYISKIEGKYNICYNNYQTKGYLGQINMILEDVNLIDMLDYYFKYHITDSGYMFFNGLAKIENTKNTTLGESVRKMSLLLFKKKLNIKDLRFEYLKEYYKTEHTYEEKENMHRNMNVLYNPANDLLY